jgi:hypothetical protein
MFSLSWPRRKSPPIQPIGQIVGWKTILNALTIAYGDRMTNLSNQ